MSLIDLPLEIHDEIFAYLSYADHKRLERVCKQLHIILTSTTSSVIQRIQFRQLYIKDISKWLDTFRETRFFLHPCFMKKPSQEDETERKAKGRTVSIVFQFCRGSRTIKVVERAFLQSLKDLESKPVVLSRRVLGEYATCPTILECEIDPLLRAPVKVRNDMGITVQDMLCGMRKLFPKARANFLKGSFVDYHVSFSG